VVQPPGGARLLLEPANPIGIGGERRRQYFHGDIAIEPGIASAIDLAPPASANCVQDLVRSEPHPGFERHGQPLDPGPIIRALPGSEAAVPAG